LSGTPANQDIGTNTFVVRVTESAGMSNTATMFLNVNGPPTFRNSDISRSPVNAGGPYAASIAGEATDPNPGDLLTFSKLSGPDWLIVSPQGALSGTPANSDAGTNVFTVRVSDSGGLSDAATLLINVNGPPSFEANPFTAPATMVGQSYSHSITNQASDPNPGAVLSFAKLSGPAWLNIAPNGMLSGTPTTADSGTNSFHVLVNDGQGLTNTAIMNLSVLPATGSPMVQIVLTNNAISLVWTDGNPPFQVQVSTNFSSGNWQDLGQPTTNHSIAVEPGSPSATYRVKLLGL
jgi:hypothetical protein